MKDNAVLLRELAASVVDRTIRELINANNEHARGQLVAYANGVLDSALRVGAICQSENQSAQHAMKGDQLLPDEDLWW